MIGNPKEDLEYWVVLEKKEDGQVYWTGQHFYSFEDANAEALVRTSETRTSCVVEWRKRVAWSSPLSADEGGED